MRQDINAMTWVQNLHQFWGIIKNDKFLFPVFHYLLTQLFKETVITKLEMNKKNKQTKGIHPPRSKVQS